MSDEQKLSVNDIRVLEMLAGATFKPAAEITLPSGTEVRGSDMPALISENTGETEVEVVWRAKDEEGVEFELTRILKGGRISWELSATKGPFSGYPTINLDLEALARLHSVLDDEIYVVDSYPPKDKTDEAIWSERSVVEPKED